MNDSEGWEKILDDKICKLERKMMSGSEVPVARTTATIEGFGIDEIWSAITDIETRRKWDENFEVFEVVDSTEKYDVLYMILKVKKL